MDNDRYIRLLTKELCNELTDAEREELTELLRENKGYRDQKEILKEYWEKEKDENEANAAMFKKVIDKIRVIEKIKREEEAIDIPKRRIGRTLWYSAAAVLLLIAGPYAWRHFQPKRTTTPALATPWLQMSTRPVRKSVLTLPDGTTVALNSATTIKYPEHFSDSAREVYLDGEAYFTVVKDPLHPFIIHAGKMNIRVLGTDFNVKSYQNEALSEASLIRGSIEVTLNDRPSDRIILKPKEKLIVQNSLSIMKRVPAGTGISVQDSAAKGTRYSLTNLTYFPNNDKTVVETSWVENKLVFSDKDFAQLSGQLERWYGVHIEFANEQVKKYRFTGFFEKESLPEALNVLKMIEHFNYRISDSTVFIF